MSFNVACLLLSLVLCRAVHDKPVIALAGFQTATLVADGISTRKFVAHGGHEVDPVARVLIGARPTWSRMAPLGVAQVTAEVWLAEQMRHSRRGWMRAAWWIPLAAGTVANGWATAHNAQLVHRMGR